MVRAASNATVTHNVHISVNVHQENSDWRTEI